MDVWVKMEEPQPATERLDLDELQQELDTRFMGQGERLLYLPVVDSTNTLAMRQVAGNADRALEGLVVLADSQTAGRGRQGRRWVDVAGRNVLASTVLYPRFPPYLLTMGSALAVVAAIRMTTGLVAALKWPNDVLIGERKVAGILIETCRDRAGRLVAVVGIGVNVNGRSEDLPIEQVSGGSVSSPPETAATAPALLVQAATTLEAEYGAPVSRPKFIARLLEQLEDSYLALQEEAEGQSAIPSSEPPSRLVRERHVSRIVRERWRSCLITLGRTVQVRQGTQVIEGVAEEVNERGELLLRRHSGELVTITWGDVGHLAG
jgi:BirA family biotin operon repressor/biotin-[acetyl-CoA-carboxylase] ligase